MAPLPGRLTLSASCSPQLRPTGTAAFFRPVGNVLPTGPADSSPAVRKDHCRDQLRLLLAATGAMLECQGPAGKLTTLRSSGSCPVRVMAAGPALNTLFSATDPW